jgi:hypothetical protein
MSYRIEPVPRADEIDEGLAARVFDPLWLLARQWQLGEFRAQDAMSPAVVHLRGRSTPLTGWRAGPDTRWHPYDPAGQPLEALVEAEGGGPDLRGRLEAGAHLLRLLRAAGLEHYLDRLVAAHPFPDGLDWGGDALLAAVAAATPDRDAVAATVGALAAGQDGGLGARPEDAGALRAAAEEWLRWYPAAGATAAASPAAWDPQRLEHRFSVASADAVLEADEYTGDGIDWYDFDVAATGAVGTPGGETDHFELRAVPAPVRYGGMPASRYWEMEDARFDYGGVDVSAVDLGRLLLVEFVTVYGNDWFLAPLELRVGTLTVLDDVIATDVAGRHFRLGRAGAGDANWNLFTLSRTVRPGDKPPPADPVDGALFLPSSLPFALESDPVEEAMLLRDELANMAWAIERVVEDDVGERTDRREAWLRDRPAAPPPGPLPAYRVETLVPDYWVPLLPERLDRDGSVQLRLVPFATPVPTGADGEATIVQVGPKGRLLGQVEWLFEEEVPRSGAVVSRLRRRGRWYDGRILGWTGRRKRIGRGEGSSGLRFDVIEPD